MTKTDIAAWIHLQENAVVISSTDKRGWSCLSNFMQLDGGMAPWHWMVQYSSEEGEFHLSDHDLQFQYDWC